MSSSEDVLKTEDIQEETQHKIDSLSLLLFLGLLILTTFLIWLFKKKRFRLLHETGVAMIMGMLAGFLIDLAEPQDAVGTALCNTTNRPNGLKTVEDEATFDPETFFFVLLPPIIFNAGYDLKQKHFFRNIVAILVYAFIGTTMATFITGGMLYSFSRYIKDVGLDLVESMLFGAFISATDPVTVLAIYHDLHVDHSLYAIVFGESVMNDAVALVLYSTIEEFKGSSAEDLNAGSVIKALFVFLLIFLGSLACGVLLAMLTALIAKFTKIRRFPLIETSLFILFSYMSFLVGEASGLSGIVAVLFCGITQANYTYPNLSEESKSQTRKFFQLLNFLAENFIFAYIGLSFFTYRCHKWDAAFTSWSIVTILVARAMIVYPLSVFINLCRGKRGRRIPMSFQHCLFGAGLRGAIAFALAMRNTASEQRQMILSTTLIIVFTTVMVFGGGTMQLLQRMKIRVGVTDEDDETRAKSAPKKSCIAKSWQGFDKKYLRPVLVNTDQSQGVDNMNAVFRTIRQYWKGEKESYVVEKDPFDSDSEDDGDVSDVDSAASSELLDFDDDDDDDETDAFSGDIGRASNTMSPPQVSSNFFKGFEPMSTPTRTNEEEDSE